MASDLAVIRQLLRGEPRGGDHKDRLERFYGPQADAYDRFANGFCMVVAN